MRGLGMLIGTIKQGTKGQVLINKISYHTFGDLINVLAMIVKVQKLSPIFKKHFYNYIYPSARQQNRQIMIAFIKIKQTNNHFIIIFISCNDSVSKLDSRSPGAGFFTSIQIRVTYRFTLFNKKLQKSEYSRIC